MSLHALAMLSLPGGIGLTSLLLYLAAALAIPLSLFVQPRIGLYVLIPMMPLQTVRYQLQGLPFGDKLVDILLLSVIFGLLIWKSDEIPLKTPINSYLLFFCLFLYATLWVGSIVVHMPWPILPNDERFVVWKNTAEMPLLFLVVASAIENKKQMMLLLCLMMITVLRANIGFFHTVSGRDFTHFSNNLRYAGVLGYAGQKQFALDECREPWCFNIDADERIEVGIFTVDAVMKMIRSRKIRDGKTLVGMLWLFGGRSLSS